MENTAYIERGANVVAKGGKYKTYITSMGKKLLLVMAWIRNGSPQTRHAEHRDARHAQAELNGDRTRRDQSQVLAELRFSRLAA